MAAKATLLFSAFSQASVKFKVTDKGLSNGGRRGTAICNGLLLHTSASLAKTLTFTKKGKLEGEPTRDSESHVSNQNSLGTVWHLEFFLYAFNLD